MYRSFALSALLAVTSSVALAGCGGEEEPTSQNQDIKIGDPFKGILDLYEDAKNLDLGDLLSVSAGFATDELNGALSSSPYANIQLRQTEVYALSSDASNDFTLGNIDNLVSGLAVRYGENELTTEVNAARQAHLTNSADRVYAESAFRIQAGLHNWQFATFGIGDGDGQATLGFDANADVEARIINAYESELDAHKEAPLSAVAATRGFVLPRSVDDLRVMKPGESLALGGEGRLGFNFGAGVPILTAAQSGITYSIVFSAALRVRMSGSLDVQLVKLDGDQVVVDVGMRRANLDYWRLAVQDGWGVNNLIQSEVEVGGVGIDLGRMAEKALGSKLLNKINVLDASVSEETVESRMSVARFRFGLAEIAPGAPGELAIAHALRGDIRLAQALANRDEPGVQAEFELSRSGVASTSYAGIDIFGMSFFNEVIESQGAVTIQTPGGANTILFDSLHREDGWFFSSHGYGRVALSGTVFNAEEGGGSRGEANLLLQVQEGDEFLERDKLLDQLDGVILSIGGPEALAAIEGPGNELERYVVAQCQGGGAFDPCRENVLSDPNVTSLREQGLSALASQAGHLEPGPQEVLMAAGDMRLAAQATFEAPAQFVGPTTSIVYDYRMDNAALNALLVHATRADLEQALLNYYLAEGIDRGGSADDIAKQEASIEKKRRAGIQSMGDAFERLTTVYSLSAAAENKSLPMHPELGAVGATALEIRYGVDHAKVSDYEALAARSLSQTRAEIAAQLFDELVAKARDEGKKPERAVVYALLSLAPAEHVDARLNLDFDFSNTWAQEFGYYEAAGYRSIDVYGRASGSSPIDGGLFDLQQLIQLN